MTDALQDYLDSVRDTPFQWGVHDCGLFSAKGWDANGGSGFVDRVAALGITSAREYRRRQRDGMTLEAVATEVAGHPVVDEPQRGDLVLVRTSRGAVLGIAVPPLALCAGPHGTIALPLHAERVWRAPCRK